MLVANIQRFSMHDGPGIRTTVFLKGCPLTCAWCHNPETQSRKAELLFYANKCIGCGNCNVCSQDMHRFSPSHAIHRELCTGCGKCAEECPTGALELAGKAYFVQELVAILEKDRAFYGASGGVTLSGGEPFAQDEALSLLKLCKERGLHTVVETCGYVSAEILRQAVPLTDLFMWDIKDTDIQRHIEYTGVSNERILQNLKLADSMGAKTRIRCILVNGVNTTETHYHGIAELYHGLNNCEGVEFLPYHSFGGTKYAALGKTGGGSDGWIPSKEQISHAKTELQQRGIPVF